MHKYVTLITGASKGIGRHLVEHYIEKGHFVFGCSRGDSDYKHENYIHLCADVSIEDDVKKMMSVIRSKSMCLDNLINNAGIAAMNHALLTPANSIEKILKTNVLGTFLLCREAAKIMSKKKHGRIVNFTTVAVPLKLEGEAIYASSKAAIHSLTQILAYEFSDLGITVNSIGPTPIDTDLTRSIPQSKLSDLVQRQAIKRFGELRDVSNVVDFYLKDSSEFITGQVLYLGGVS